MKNVFKVKVKFKVIKTWPGFVDRMRLDVVYPELFQSKTLTTNNIVYDTQI